MHRSLPVSYLTDPLEFLTDVREEIEYRLTERLDAFHSVKFYILAVKLSKINRLEEEIICSPSFRSKVQTPKTRLHFQSMFNDQ